MSGPNTSLLDVIVRTDTKGWQFVIFGVTLVVGGIPVMFKNIVLAAIAVLSSGLLVLQMIPGYQGEDIIAQVIAYLQKLVQ